MPGLAFLMWAWVGSYWNAGYVRSRSFAKSGSDSSGLLGRELSLNRGAVIFSQVGLKTQPPSTIVFRMPMRHGLEKAAPAMAGGLWGMDREVSEVGNSRDRFLLERTARWFSFGFVVLGYVGAWTGVLVIWRRRMERRWRAALVVGE